MNTTLCNMCLIEAPDGRVVIQHRLPKPDKAWSSLTFPGGHVESSENVTAATIREIEERTCLTVSDLRSCGFVEWWNPEKQSLIIVFLFRTDQYKKNIPSCKSSLSRTGNPDTLLSLSRVLTNLLRLDAGRLGVLSFLSSFFPVLCAL